MTISVIMPVLDEERTLPQTLAHTVRLGFDELIVVDGSSHDRTGEIVRAFAAGSDTLLALPRGAVSDPVEEPNRSLSEAVPGGQPFAARLLTPSEGGRSHAKRGEGDQTPHASLSALSPQPSALTFVESARGRAKQMNTGAVAARGDVLLFLHVDTLLPDDARARIVAALDDPACVGGRFNVRFDRVTPLGRMISGLMNLRSRLTGIATGDQAIFVRRAIFERLGGYAELPLMEDVDLSRRLKRAGRMAALPAQVVTSYRRWERRGPIRTILLMWALRFLYWAGVDPARLARWYGHVR